MYLTFVTIYTTLDIIYDEILYMPMAAFGVGRILIATAIIFLVSFIDVAPLIDGAVQLFVFGRVPGTNAVIKFEAFFPGMIFVAWMVITYNAAIKALILIHEQLRGASLSRSEIEEIAL